MVLAEQRDLVVLAHVDDDAIERLMVHSPTQGRELRIVWALTGIGGASVERVDALMARSVGRRMKGRLFMGVWPVFSAFWAVH